MEKQGVSAVTEYDDEGRPKLTREERKYVKAFMKCGVQWKAYQQAIARKGVTPESCRAGNARWLNSRPHVREAIDQAEREALVSYNIDEGTLTALTMQNVRMAQDAGQYMASQKGLDSIGDQHGLMGRNYRDPGLENIGATLVNFVGEGLARKLLEAQGLPIPTALIEGEAQEVPAKDSAE